MFIGEFRHSIDMKSRIAIPAKFRTKLAGGAIIAKGLDNSHCLYLLTVKDWESFVQKIVSASVGKADSRALSRHVLSGASEVTLDGQGRILIPDNLKKYAGLGKEAVIVGVYNRMEIWDVKAWEDYKAKTESQSEEIAEKLSELGI
jgi:MraZ protein